MLSSTSLIIATKLWCDFSAKLDLSTRYAIFKKAPLIWKLCRMKRKSSETAYRYPFERKYESSSLMPHGDSLIWLCTCIFSSSNLKKRQSNDYWRTRLQMTYFLLSLQIAEFKDWFTLYAKIVRSHSSSQNKKLWFKDTVIQMECI